jgi:hypothetical protein
MVTLESLTWKVCKHINRPLTYQIGSKCWQLYVICEGINWKSMPHRDIMRFDTLFYM